MGPQEGGTVADEAAPVPELETEIVANEMGLLPLGWMGENGRPSPERDAFAFYATVGFRWLVTTAWDEPVLTLLGLQLYYSRQLSLQTAGGRLEIVRKLILKNSLQKALYPRLHLDLREPGSIERLERLLVLDPSQFPKVRLTDGP